MKVSKTKLEGCFIIKNNAFQDKRGYFFESYNQNKINEIVGKEISFVQDNESFSLKGTLRGLHFQKGKNAQAKLVRVIKGKVIDIAVDLRKNSSTYGKHISIELTEGNKKQIFIPRGFAHGFIVISDTAIFSYKCDNYYNKESEGGIIYNDPSLDIDWHLSPKDFIVSEKDLLLPKLDNVKL